MLHIEIASEDIELIEGNSKKTGKPYSIRKQQAWVFLPGDKYPTEIGLNLEEDQPAFPNGMYELHATSAYVDRYKNLQLGNIKLTPRKSAKAA